MACFSKKEPGSSDGCSSSGGLQLVWNMRLQVLHMMLTAACCFMHGEQLARLSSVSMPSVLVNDGDIPDLVIVLAGGLSGVWDRSASSIGFSCLAEVGGLSDG